MNLFCVNSHSKPHIQKGADPNVAVAKGIRPLRAAAKIGDIAIVMELVNNGANVNAQYEGFESKIP